MEREAAPNCEYCRAEAGELYLLPLLLQVGDRVLSMVCRFCYTYLSGAEPRHRPVLTLGETNS